MKINTILCKIQKLSHAVSIEKRLTLTIGVGLCALLLTHVSLNVFFIENLYSAEQNRLQNMIQYYQKNITFNEKGDMVIPPEHQEDNVISPKNKLNLYIWDQTNQNFWSSSQIDLGTMYTIQKKYKNMFPNKMYFSYGKPTNPNNMYTASLLFNKEDGLQTRKIAIIVNENAQNIDIRIQTLSTYVWLMLALSFLCILIAQMVSIRWISVPLKKLNQDIKKIKQGELDFIEGSYPKELVSIKEGINSLLSHEVKQTEIYRNSLSNLAHSLKTPLAVITSLIENTQDKNNPSTWINLENQVKKINMLISYQLSLASRSGHSTFTQPIELEPICIDIVESLEKIYKAKKAFCEFDIQDKICWKANNGDIQELFGNLLENAFKWCNQRVLLTIYMDSSLSKLMISVEDDGPGIPIEHMSHIMERGVRVDEQKEGQGIGLSIVKDIVYAYDGILQISSSETLKGAKFKITFPVNP